MEVSLLTAAHPLPRAVAAEQRTCRVAEEMMMRRSGRLRCTFFSRPSSRSVAVLRSCASSTITTLQCRV